MNNMSRYAIKPLDRSEQMMAEHVMCLINMIVTIWDNYNRVAIASGFPKPKLGLWLSEPIEVRCMLLLCFALCQGARSL